MRLLLFAGLMTTLAPAQWLRQPTAGVPRLANGRPDFAGAAPKTAAGTPDISGIWRILPARMGADFTRELKPEEIQPWAARVHEQRVQDLYRDSPSVKCLPMGPLASAFGLPDGFKIIQTPSLIAMLYPDLTYRQIFMDGRTLETNPNPSWMGYSVGHWEGDTLVIESNGYNDRSWLDMEGHPHSESLRVTERLRRTSFGSMDLAVTFHDPAVYSRPIQIDTRMQALPDTEMLEYVCAENEKDKAHLVGTVGEDPTVELSPEVLSSYLGTYGFPNPVGPGTIALEVVLSSGKLSIDHPLFGKTTLRPIGGGVFSGGGTSVRFVDEGGTKAVIFSAVEGEFKAVRKN